MTATMTDGPPRAEDTAAAPEAHHDTACDFCGEGERLSCSLLCPDCDASEGIRVLYRGARGRPAGWDKHLKRLADRARNRLPLFS